MTTTKLTFMTLTLLCLPLALAGPNAGVGLLEDDARCAGDSYGDSYGGHGNDSWWSVSSYGSSQACADEAGIARAHAAREGRTLADARVATERGNETRYDRYDSSHGGPSYYGRYEEARESRADREARVVEVRSIEGDVRASDGCSSTSDRRSTSGYSSSSYDDGSWYENEGRSSASSGSSACGRSVAAQHAGENASVDQGARCSWTYADSSSRSRSTYGSGSWSSTGRSESCQDGVRAAALGEHASAGRETGCAGTSQDVSNGGDNSTYAWSHRSTSCSDALVVRGPEGLVLTIGSVSTESRSCGTETCQEWSSSFRSIAIESRHTGVVLVPLP